MTVNESSKPGNPDGLPGPVFQCITAKAVFASITAVEYEAAVVGVDLVLVELRCVIPGVDDYHIDEHASAAVAEYVVLHLGAHIPIRDIAQLIHAYNQRGRF